MKSLESKPKLPFCPFVVVSFVSSTLLCLSLRLLLLRQVRSVAPIGSTGTIPERKPVPVAANVVAVVVVVPSRTVEQVAWVEIPAKEKREKKRGKTKTLVSVGKKENAAIASPSPHTRTTAGCIRRATAPSETAAMP
jgi:hypothetical protein